MKFIFTFFLLSIFIFSNSLYYSLCLLVLILFLLSFLFSNYFISSLSLLIFFIVYIGAMMILIGYVCAVCPNILVQSNSKLITILSLFSFSLFFLFGDSFTQTPSSLNSIFSFFYSLDGIFIFFILVFMLFFTLLIVTTYYSNPNGPFRSIS